MFTTSNEKANNLPLYEFISLPSTVAFYYWYTIPFQNFIAQRPYIRLGKILSDNIAILYTSEEYMDSIFSELGYDFLSVLPEVYGLTAKTSLEAAEILRIQQRPYLNLDGKGVTLIFIDTGIDYKNSVFQYEDGTTKISFI